MPDIAAVVNGTGGGNAVELSGVFSQITELLPVVLPVVIGYIAFRKGYGFLKGTLKSA